MDQPYTNRFVERYNRTLVDEFFGIMGRKKFYEYIEEMQMDLDAYLVTYNTKRPHQGRGMQDRTPAEVFVRCLPKLKTPKGGNNEKSRLNRTPTGAAGVR